IELAGNTKADGGQRCGDRGTQGTHEQEFGPLLRIIPSFSYRVVTTDPVLVSMGSGVAVVRCLARDEDIMRMALLHTRGGDPDEPGILQRLHGGSSAIAHTGAQAPDQLVHNLVQVP